MKNQWKRIFSAGIILVTFATSAVNPLLEKLNRKQSAIDEKKLEQLGDMNKLELLAANPLGKDTILIKKMQLKQGNALFKEYDRLNQGKNPRDKVTVEKYRNGEVLLITIPSSMLFLPNETELRSNASKYLSPVARFPRNPDMYWIILDMHTDNTGSKEYTDSIALSRVDAIYDWYDNGGHDTRFVFPTASGSSEPLPGNKNLSMLERARNRRLEIYLVPGYKMLEQAKKGRISF